MSWRVPANWRVKRWTTAWQIDEIWSPFEVYDVYYERIDNTNWVEWLTTYFKGLADDVRKVQDGRD